MIKLLICDLDGTLIDSAPGIVKAAQDMFREFNYPEISSERIVSAIGYGLRHFLIELDPSLKDNPDQVENLVTAYRKIYKDKYLAETPEYSHVFPYLEKTELKIAIVTNKNEDYARLTLSYLPIGKLPWVDIVGADTFEEKKPHPMPLLKTLEKAGVEAHEAIMIGDGVPDVLAAKAAGTHLIAVDYGYGPVETLKSKGAETFVSSFAELPKHIEVLNKNS